MTDEFIAEYTQALWRNQESAVATMPAEQLHIREQALREQFRATVWIPFAVATVLAFGFATALLFSGTSLDQLGGSTGIFAAVYLAAAASRIVRRSEPAESTCARAYLFHLAQQRDALNVCCVTFLLIGLACVLFNYPLNATASKTLLSISGSSIASLASYWYVRQQAKRYQTRIDEVARIAVE